MALSRLDTFKEFIKALAEAEPRSLTPFEGVPGGPSLESYFAATKVEKEKIVDSLIIPDDPSEEALAELAEKYPKKEIDFPLIEISVEALSDEERDHFASVVQLVVSSALYEAGLGEDADNLMDGIDMPAQVIKSGKLRIMMSDAMLEAWGALGIERRYKEMLMVAKSLPWKAETVTEIDMVSGDETAREVFTLPSGGTAGDVFETVIAPGFEDEPEEYNRAPDGRIVKLEGEGAFAQKFLEIVGLTAAHVKAPTEEIREMVRRADAERAELFDECIKGDPVVARMNKAAPLHFVVSDTNAFRQQYKDIVGVSLPVRGIRPDGV
ncbi:MAG: hypothetical protein EB060_08950 [Proteobacteria bacterium]|nr:hypothetical protein [Pseudomonadota bacterium]